MPVLRVLLALAVACTFVPFGVAVPNVPAPAFLTAPHSYTPGQLLVRIPNQSRITNVAYHNGELVTNLVDGNGRKVWRWSNPASVTSLSLALSQSAGQTVPLINDQGNHAHTKIGDYLGGFYQLGLKRTGVGVNGYGGTANTLPEPDNFLNNQPATATSSARHRLYYPWTAGFHWVQYDGGNRGNLVYRGEQLIADFNPLGDHGVTGNSILMGNILLVTSDESATGILAYDLGPSLANPGTPPVLLDKLTGHFGAYISALWENYIVLSRRDTRTIDLIDWSDPTNLRYVTSIATVGGHGSSVPYVQCQDNYVFTQSDKINMETFEVEVSFDHADTGNRPAGSLSGGADTSQYMMPLGPFVVTGPYSFTGRDALGIWAHQTGPDNRAPRVGYHIPRPGQTNYPRGAAISLLIHETLESFTIVNGETIILREVGTTTPIPCYTSFSHDDILTLTPRQYLAADKTYEVVIPAGGIKDAAGNGIEAYTFTFSTGSSLSGAINASPVITTFAPDQSPAPVGATLTFTAAATDPEGDPLEYRFFFGDGSPATAWSTAASATRTYAARGHYEVKVQVRDTKPDGSRSQVVRALTVTLANPPSATTSGSTSSGPLTLDATARRLYAVDPDSDTVAAVDLDSGAKLYQTDLRGLPGFDTRRLDPRNVALDANGLLWITCYDADGLALVKAATGALVGFLPTGYGSAPVGIVSSPDRANLFVTLEARGATNRTNGSVVRYSAATRAETGRRELGPTPRALAMTAAGDRLFITRFISLENLGQVWEVNPSTMVLARTIPLYRDRGDRGFDGASHGAGVPNYVSSIALTPDGTEAWYTAVKADTQRGTFFNQGIGANEPLAHDHTVRAMVGRISLATHTEPSVTNWSDSNPPSLRLDIDNSDSPTAVAFSPLGDYAFVTLQGNNGVAVYDRFVLTDTALRGTTWRIPAGAAPQGAAFDPTTGRLYVKNLLDRDLSVHDLAPFLSVGDRGSAHTRIQTTTTERLAPDVLLGKKLFYHASDRMSHENYLSCASCHADGAHDGRTYDFTQRGEGLRNTTDLRGRAGLRHGNVHWTANFNEIQDFILDIVDEFGGTGFLPDGQDPHPALGAPNAGRSADLDALAAYVTSLDASTLPRSPYRDANTGAMTSDALLGAQLFAAHNCTTCHAPAFDYTHGTAATLHNTGTLRTSSGQRLGGPLAGIDTPTLLGTWATAPWLHDGSAETIADVFTKAGGTVVQAETGALNSTNTSVIRVRSGDDAIINYDASAQGRFVEFNASTAAVTYTGIDGGDGGTAALEFRFESSTSRSFTVTINGTARTVSVPNDYDTRLEWRRAFLSNVTLNAGPNNTIVVTSGASGTWRLDSFTVATADHLLLAHPHRRVTSLSTSDQARLTQFILQLDGSDLGGDSLPAIQTTTLPAINEHAPYLLALDATGGDGTRTWTVSAGSLPPGVALDSADGELSGTPTDYGTYAFTITLADANGSTMSQAYTLTVHPASFAPATHPAITTLSLPAGTQHVAYSTTLTATGGTTPRTWMLLAGPPTLTLSSSGTLSGTPSVHGSHPVTVRVTSANGQTDEHTFTLALTSAYDAWTASHSWPGDAALTSVATADPDADGVPNLLEYALEGNPVASSSAPATTLSTATGTLRLTYLRARPGLTYTVETSTDLNTWTTTGVIQDTTTPVGANATATVPYDPPTTPRRFLRLSVTQ